MNIIEAHLAGHRLRLGSFIHFIAERSYLGGRFFHLKMTVSCGGRNQLLAAPELIASTLY